MRKKVLTKKEHLTKTKNKKILNILLKILNILLKILLIVISLTFIVMCSKKILSISDIIMEKIINHICSASTELFFWELYFIIGLIIVLYTLIFYYSQKTKLKKRR